MPVGMTITYPVDLPVHELDAARKRGWEHQRQQRARTRAAGSKLRRDWFPPAQSLKALRDCNRNGAQKIRIVRSDKPHVIQLLKEVGNLTLVRT
jgi:hypothetical protein